MSILDNSPAIKAIVWDVDGVLLNMHDGTARLYNQTVEEKLGVSAQKFKEKLWDGRFEPCLVGQADTREMIMQALQELGVCEYADWYMDYWFDCADEKDAATFALKAQVDLPHFLGTNQCKTRGAHIWEGLGFKDEFMAMFASGFLGSRKPEEAFFEKAHTGVISHVGPAQPNEVLFFDDMPENIAAAKAFGWQAHQFRESEDAERVLKQLGLIS